MSKITKEEKAYVDQCKVWLKTQQCAIDSCTLSIKHAKENIALANRRIRLETAELKSKEATKDAVIKNMNAILSRNKKAKSIIVNNSNNKKEQPKPATPKVDKKELEHSIKSHEQAKSQNQTVKK